MDDLNSVIKNAIVLNDIDALQQIINSKDSIDLNRILIDTIQYTPANIDFIKYLIKNGAIITKDILLVIIIQNKILLFKNILKNISFPINIMDELYKYMIDEYAKTNNIYFIKVIKCIIKYTNFDVYNNIEKIFEIITRTRTNIKYKQKLLLCILKRYNNLQNAAEHKQFISKCSTNIKKPSKYPVGFNLDSDSKSLIYCSDKKYIIKLLKNETLFRYALMNLQYINKYNSVVYKLPYPDVYITQKSIIDIIMNPNVFFDLRIVGTYTVGTDINGKIGGKDVDVYSASIKAV
jgi:hypothetical protein